MPTGARLPRGLLPTGLIIASFAALSACSDSLTAPLAPVPPEPARVLLAQPSFARDIQEIFERRGCAAAGCHAMTEPRAGLILTRSRARAALVGVAARAEEGVLVIPGDPHRSYLLVRLEGRQWVGSRMPLGQLPLDSIDLGNIRNWILSGAENNE